MIQDQSPHLARRKLAKSLQFPGALPACAGSSAAPRNRPSASQTPLVISHAVPETSPLLLAPSPRPRRPPPTASRSRRRSTTANSTGTASPPATRDSARSVPSAATIANPTSLRDDAAPPRPEHTGTSIRQSWRAIPARHRRRTRKSLRRSRQFRPAARADTWPRIHRATKLLRRDHIGLGPTRPYRARDSAHRDKSSAPPCRSAAGLHTPEFSMRPSRYPAVLRTRSLTIAANPAPPLRRY